MSQTSESFTLYTVTTPNEQLKNCIRQCQRCPLFEQISKPPMPFDGIGTIPIMLVTDSPGIEEYNNDAPFYSQAGSYFEQFLQRAGFYSLNEFIRTSVVKCHQMRFEGNTPPEALVCGDWLDREIELFKPRLIVAFGNLGLYRFSNEYFNQQYEAKKDGTPKELKGILDKHGLIEWSERYQCHVMYMMHPSMVLKQRKYEQVFQDACSRMYSFYRNNFSFENLVPTTYYNIYPKNGDRLAFLEEARKFLNWITQQPDYAVDIETTGLDWLEDEILMVSFSWAEGHSCTVLWDDELLSEFKKALESPAKKCMHNGKFDCHFFHEKGIYPVNFDFDTQLAAHLIDENSPTNLGACTTRYLGLGGDYKEKFWGGQKNKKIVLNTEEDIVRACIYANMDTDNTRRLRIVFEQKLRELDIYPPVDGRKRDIYLFSDISMPLLHVLLEIEKNGLSVNRDYQDLVEKVLYSKSEQVFKEAEELIYQHMYPNPQDALAKQFAYFESLYSQLTDIIKSAGSGGFTPLYFQNCHDMQVQYYEFKQKIECILSQQLDKKTFKESLVEAVKLLEFKEKQGNDLEDVLMDGFDESAKKKPKTTKKGLFVTFGKIKTAIKRVNADLRPQLEQISNDLDNFLINIDNLSGIKMNITSPKQMSFILYDVLNLPIYNETDKGTPSTDKETMELLAKEHPFPKLIVEHRHITHDISNYIDAVREAVAADNRIHPNFSQTKAVTGRLSCSDPALHGISRNYMIRNMFVPARGNLFIEADYSQMEVRMLAEISGDANLKSVFTSGGDVHTENARRIFKIPPDVKPTKEQRAQTKRVVFGLIYGLAVETLAANLGISAAEAQALFDAFYSAYPDTKVWMDQTKDFLRRFGFVRNYYGRVRRIPTIFSSNKWERLEAERQCINAPIQSSATADYSGLSHVKLQEMIEREYKGTGVRQVINHHDCVLIEAPIELVTELKPKIQWVGENADPAIDVKVLFEPDVVRCWSGCPMSDEDIELYKIEETLGMLPKVGYCKYHLTDKEDNPLFYEDGSPKLCNQMFLPYSYRNIHCPDHHKS